MIGVGALRLARFGGVCTGETLGHNFFVGLDFAAPNDDDTGASDTDTSSAPVLALVLARLEDANELVERLVASSVPLFE